MSIPNLKELFQTPFRALNISTYVLTFHILMVPSQDAEANCFPSGLQATELTELVCPFKVFSSFPVAASHIFIAPAIVASDPEASCFPSGLQATDLTEYICPIKVRNTFSVFTSHILIVLSSDPEANCCPFLDSRQLN